MEYKHITYLKACLRIETEYPTDNRNHADILEYIEQLEREVICGKRLIEIGRATEKAMKDGARFTVFSQDIDYLLQWANGK